MSAVHKAWQEREAMKPRIGITDPAFVWVNAVSTDLKKTFERERARIEEASKPKPPSPESQRVTRLFDQRRIK